MNEFEKKLEQQTLRQIPTGWREEILAAARAAQPATEATRVPSRSFLSTINSQLSALLWPHPKAWAVLAAVWVGIIALHLVSQDLGPSPRLAGRAAPASSELMAEMQKQQKMYAELMGAGEPRVAERPKDVPVRPRTQRVEVLVG